MKKKIAIATLILGAISVLGTSPASATINACLTRLEGAAGPGGTLSLVPRPLSRVWVEHFWTTVMTDEDGCFTLPRANGSAQVRVYAHNPVVRMDDGPLAIAVSQVVSVVDGGTTDVSDQVVYYAMAERMREAYNQGVREFDPWQQEFPVGVASRSTGQLIRAAWPDLELAGVDRLAFVEPKSQFTGFPLIHLLPGDQSDDGLLAHELGHALHFSQLSESQREEIQDRYLDWLINDPEPTHCFEKRTIPLVAYLEAWGLFAEVYQATTQINAAAGPVRHEDFFDRIENDTAEDVMERQSTRTLRELLRDPNPGCERREPGPMGGDDVEGAVFLTLFLDFARHPAVGLDLVVENYVTCESLDMQQFGRCMRDRFGSQSEVFRALVSAGMRNGIEFDIVDRPIDGGAESGDRLGEAVVSGDFNGDGLQDLAIGVPEESVGSVAAAGAVNVIYGTLSGLGRTRNQIWYLGKAGLSGTPVAGDRFGAALESGDFDGDGFDDLAVGMPGATVAGRAAAGMVIVLRGAELGLTSSGVTRLFEQAWGKGPGLPGLAEIGDRLGSALASGDFDANGYADLAIGLPRQTAGGAPDAGMVTVVYGSVDGLDETDAQVLRQGYLGIEGQPAPLDKFGSALAAGDFDGDGDDDLAVGVPGEDVTGALNAGAVNVIYSNGDRLDGTRDLLLTQDTPGIWSPAETGDAFGSSLASGDFDGNEIADLAVGVPREDIGEILDAGAVNVIYGKDPHGLDSRGDQGWSQNSSGIWSSSEIGDGFGGSLSAGDFNGDDVADLAIGVTHEDIGAIVDAGAVNVLYGQPVNGLSADSDQGWSQNTGPVSGDYFSIADSSQTGDGFGVALAAGDFNGDGRADLAIGVSFEDVGSRGDAGAVNVLYGSRARLARRGNQIWHQNR